MKTLLLTTLFIGFTCANLQAQFTKSINLKPIHIQGEPAFGMKFRYGLKTVKDAYALEIPLIELENEQVSKDYKSFKNFNTAANWVSWAPVFYLAYEIGNAQGGRRFSANNFLAIWTGSLLTAWGLRIGGRVKLRRAINSYNELIFTPESNSQINFGVKVGYRF
jgi:hypothetical protein